MFSKHYPSFRLRQSDVYECANDNKGRQFRHIELPSKEEDKSSPNPVDIREIAGLNLIFPESMTT